MALRLTGMVFLEVAELGSITDLQPHERPEASTAAALARRRQTHSIRRPGEASTGQQGFTSDKTEARVNTTTSWDNGQKKARDISHPKPAEYSHESMKEAIWIHSLNAEERMAEAVKRGPSSIEAASETRFSGEGSHEVGIDLKSTQRKACPWTALISQHAKRGQGRQALKIYEEMRQKGVEPSSRTLVAVLKACTSLQDLESAKRIHADVVRSGFESDLYVGNILIHAYVKCRSLMDARHAFENMPRRDVVSWTAMIFGYALMDKGEEALQMYSRMQQEGVLPNDRTYISVLKACSAMAESGEKNEGYGKAVKARCLEIVRAIHTDIVTERLEGGVFVATMLVDAYGKCGSLHDAKRVFEKMPVRSVVSWTAMIFGYAQMNGGEEALQLYTRMQQEGVMPNDRTYVSALKACSSLAELEESDESDGIGLKKRSLDTVRTIHANLRKGRFESDLFVGNMLVDVYAKCGSLEEARRVFEEMPHRDVVSWNAMILGYAQMDEGEVALHLYNRMQQEGVEPNERTYIGALNACGSVAGLEKGKQIHFQILRARTEALDSFVANSLVDMYGKCGSMFHAQEVFDALPKRDTVAWSALLAGYAYQGESELAFDVFERMKQDSIEPHGITFLSLLTVCSHAGLVDKGQMYFEAMSRDYGITPTIKHYTCMVDLLGRAGYLEKAMEVVKTMPFRPQGTVWRCMLGACQKWGDIELGKQAFESAVCLNKDDAAAYVLMANIYAASHMQDEAKELHAMRVKSQAWKQPGWSRWTDVRGVAHVFVGGTQISGGRKEKGYCT